jgi:hypothetical protein
MNLVEPKRFRKKFSFTKKGEKDFAQEKKVEQTIFLRKCKFYAFPVRQPIYVNRF